MTDHTIKAVAGDEWDEWQQADRAWFRSGRCAETPAEAAQALDAATHLIAKLAAAVEERDNLLLMAHADAWTEDPNFCLTVDEWKTDLAQRLIALDHKEAPDGQ